MKSLSEINIFRLPINEKYKYWDKRPLCVEDNDPNACLCKIEPEENAGYGYLGDYTEYRGFSYIISYIILGQSIQNEAQTDIAESGDAELG